MNEILTTDEINNLALENTVIDEEEFFEKSLFQDVLEMKSVKKVAESTAIDLGELQDQVYQNLFKLFQQNRGISEPENSEKDEVFAIFELFFKNYYQHFRIAMEALIISKSPIKVAYFLGKNADKITAMLDQFIGDLENEIA